MAFVHYRLRRHHALGSALISSVAALGVGLFIGTYIAGVRVTLERADSHAVSTQVAWFFNIVWAVGPYLILCFWTTRWYYGRRSAATRDI
jgi:hypothetical protein